MMKRATQTKQYAELDHALRTKVEPFLYNKGKGRWIPIEKLVLLRNKDRSRNKMLPPLRNMENPADYDIDKDMGDEEVDEKTIDKSKYRFVCWNLSDRGAVGETILHLCMLNSTAIHADLAKRLLRFYPMLINDIYLCDEYYGENVLHIAIVNEDPAMVKYLLDSGADDPRIIHERCFGTFMCPEDQKASRFDSLDHEWVCVSPETDYSGYVYWGEYPLSFSACLGQEECYRLMLARGADPDKQDTNGNTVMHMLVIYEKVTTFDMAYEVGASLSIRNNQKMTPLTLSAKLARIEMFFHILNIEREIYWQIGSITCAAYPLSQIDTIDVNTGEINKTSALNLVVFGEKDEHLELMDGVLVDLLNAKWNTFVKFRFYRQFFLFCFYFVLSAISFTFRPGPSQLDENVNDTLSTRTNFNVTATENTLLKSLQSSELSELVTNSFAAAFTSNLKSSLNMTQESLEKIQLQVTSNITSALRGILLLTLSDNEDILNIPDETAIHALWYTDSLQNMSDYFLNRYNKSEIDGNSTTNTIIDSTELPNYDDSDNWWKSLTEECRLMQLTTTKAKIRLTAEIFMEIAAVLYILAALREARFLGPNMFIENLMTAPSRVMFLFSCCILLSFPFLRLTCADEVEDMLAVVVMLTTAPYFLFFCRGFKSVGPFVVMIYRMIMGDLLRFVSIYLVFVLGFSQAYYVIFLSFDNPNTPEGIDDSVTNPMQSPMESTMAMFLMSMTNFGDYFGAFDRTEHEIEAKVPGVMEHDFLERLRVCLRLDQPAIYFRSSDISRIHHDINDTAYLLDTRLIYASFSRN